MNLFNQILVFFLGHSWSPTFTGVVPDTRPPEEKEKDYLSEERRFIQTSDPFGNPQIKESPYPYLNQLSTSECVPHAITLALAIERKNDTGNFSLLSPTFIYRLRANYAKAGSAPQDIFNLLKKYGAPLYDTLPTPQVESQANAVTLTTDMYSEAEIFKGLSPYYSLGKPNDIAAIAKIAQEGHAVPITVFATEEEYARQYPAILIPNLTYSQAEVQHEICVLPYSGFMKDGIKYVAIQDSAWFGGWKVRYLSEAFIKARCYGACYWVSVNVLGSGPRPKWLFTKSLTIGSKGTDVLMLQRLLISEGFLPNDLGSGYFGGHTRAGVKAFQMRYKDEILTPAGLTPTGYFGTLSMAVANRLCKA